MEQRYAFIVRIWQHAPPSTAAATVDFSAPDDAAHDTPRHNTAKHEDAGQDVPATDPELGELYGTLQAFDSAQLQHFNSLHDLHALLHAILSAATSVTDEHTAPSGGTSADS